MRDSGDSLMRIIDDILDFTKIERVKWLQPEPASMRRSSTVSATSIRQREQQGTAASMPRRCGDQPDPFGRPAAAPADPQQLREQCDQVHERGEIVVRAGLSGGAMETKWFASP
jgi:hypothetical protein